MTPKDTMHEKLITEFTENYMEKLFYFCLRKTGDGYEAEELAQDIALNIFIALNGGMIPTSFSAWVWQIARNRYSVWADRKHRKNESVTGSDIGDYEIEDESRNILDEMIRGEQLSLLRRELAFISSEYRNIVIAYYIENRSLREISSSLSLTESAIKQRLYRARKILKEGMNMAREFGVRSYKPEEINFTNSCSAFGDNGQPWTILSHALYKNIFLEAYGNPSTAEALSLELGVAMPYMEDELRFLTQQTFLVKNGDKYETSFPIISKGAQEKIRNYNARISAKLTRLFEKLIDDYSKACAAHGIDYYGKFQSYEDAKWTLLMHAFDLILQDASKRGESSFEYTKRPDHGRWDIVGYEKTEMPELPWVGLHGLDKKIEFLQFKFAHGGIVAKTPPYLTYEEGMTLKNAVEEKWEECDAELLETLCGYGYMRKCGAGYKPYVVVFEHAGADKYWESFSAEEKDEITETVAEIQKMLNDATDFSYKVTSDDLPPIFKNDERMCEFACRNNKYSRADVLEQALADGWIKYDNTTSPAVGSYIYI